MIFEIKFSLDYPSVAPIELQNMPAINMRISDGSEDIPSCSGLRLGLPLPRARLEVASSV